MHRPLRLIAVFAVLATALTVGMARTASAAGVATGAVFNVPTGSADQQEAIVDRIVELIDGAAAGSTIRMSMFYADDATIPDALVGAHDRGVNVQLVFDSKETGETLYPGLVSALGTDTTASSFVLACPADRGCIGNRPLSSDSINHNKFFLFSSTLGTPDVVVQSSANLHNGRDGTKGWNNALILTGNDTIYQAYQTYFGNLVARKVNNYYYTTGQPPVTSGDAKVHFYPRHESCSDSSPCPYSDPSTDTIETVLDHVDCFGNTTVGTGDHRTIIRVNQNIFSRTYLAQKLVALDKAGCYVEVVENFDPTDPNQTTALKDMLAATTSGYNGVLVRYYCSDDSVWTHSKYLMVEGNYYGGPDREIVWTGSANFSYNSLRQSDETILQLEDPTVFAAYKANFDSVRDGATHQPDNGDPATC
jgi:phosphatidylserine/phosphatidylglycerophosphate/cardiolipin synthase-like enzyme